MRRVWGLVAFVLLGFILAGVYLWGAGTYCEGEAPPRGLHLHVAPQLPEGKEQKRPTNEGRHQKEPQKAISPLLPVAYSVEQQDAGERNAGDQERTDHGWFYKFICEAKISDLAIALFTYELMVFTWWLGSVTHQLWQSAVDQEKMARTHERAYVFGGGPSSKGGEDSDTVYLTYENHGRTPAFIKRIDWGLCDEREFPADMSVSRIIDGKLYGSATFNAVPWEDIWQPNSPVLLFRRVEFRYSDNVGRIFFGRFYYKDVFGDPHHSTFKLRLRPAIEKIDSEPLSGCYSDWS